MTTPTTAYFHHVPSGSLAEDPEVLCVLNIYQDIQNSEPAWRRHQGPLRETLMGRYIYQDKEHVIASVARQSRSQCMSALYNYEIASSFLLAMTWFFKPIISTDLHPPYTYGVVTNNGIETDFIPSMHQIKLRIKLFPSLHFQFYQGLILISFISHVMSA